MTRLLVSVRSAGEALAALESGADLIDVKEPARGSLGRADQLVVQEILRAVAARRPVSAALGELLDVEPPLSGIEPLAAELAYVKIGLAGCGLDHHWPEKWRARLDAFPISVGRVAVVYADYVAAAAPPPQTILDHAVTHRCAAVLVDTWRKGHGGLVDYWTRDEIADFTHAARRQSLLTVLAGGLTPAAIQQILPLNPDYIAVRGAACAGDRAGALDATKVRRLKQSLNRRGRHAPI